MMILDNIDRVAPEELAAGVYQLLYAGTADFATQEKMRDRRLIPILNTIIQTRGRPPLAPQRDLPKDRTDRVMMSAAYLLGDIAGLEDRESVQALVDMLDDENDRVKLAAAIAMGQLGATEAAAKVLVFTERMMAQGEIGVVAKLAGALARIGSEEAKASLQRFIVQNKESEDKHVQHVVTEVETAIQSINQRLK